MTIFTIPGDDTRYHYPDDGSDVQLGTYLSFLTDIAPQEPKEVRELATITNRIQDLMQDIDPWINKVVANREMYTDIELAKMLIAHAYDPQSPKKARQLLPELATEYLSALTKRAALADAMGDLWYAKQMLPYKAKVVAHFTGVPEGRVTGTQPPGMERKAVEFIYNKIVKACEPPEEYTYQRTYRFEGETYALPERMMTNATVIEFAEAAQFQANSERLLNGHMHSLIDVIAVLLRKEGEQYSEEVYQRNRAAFVRLPLSVALDIAFFLQRQSETSVLNFTTSTTLPQGERGLKEVAQTLRQDTGGISHSRRLRKVVYSIAQTVRR